MLLDHQNRFVLDQIAGLAVFGFIDRIKLLRSVSITFYYALFSKLATSRIGIVPELGRFLSGETQHYCDNGRRSRLRRYFRLWHEVIPDSSHRPVGD